MNNYKKIYRVVKLHLEDSTTYGVLCFRTKEAALREADASNHYFRVEGSKRLAYIQELMLFDE